MKKVLKVSALLMVAALLFSACKGTHACPAYGKVQKTTTEKPA